MHETEEGLRLAGCLACRSHRSVPHPDDSSGGEDMCQYQTACGSLPAVQDDSGALPVGDCSAVQIERGCAPGFCSDGRCRCTPNYASWLTIMIVRSADKHSSMAESQIERGV